MKRYEKGSITVFLSLILLLVLAVIMTTIEAARVNAASALSLRALMTGLDSVMAEYYSPLYKEYHIFGLDASYGSSEVDQDTIIRNLNNYMEYTFKPDKDLTENNINSAYLKLYGMQDIAGDAKVHNVLNLYAVNTDSTTIDKSTSLLDYKGKLFEKQALEYMKFKTPANTVTNFLDHTALIKDTKESVEILEEKEKTEAYVQKIDEIILKLMEKIDGISITRKGIHMKSGQIVVKEYFIKKFQDSPVTMSSAGINNEWVFGAVKSHYRDVSGEMSVVINQVDAIVNLNSSMKELQNEIASLAQADTSKMTKSQKKEHKEKIENAKDQLNNLNDDRSTLIGVVNSNINAIKQQITEVLKVTKESIAILDKGQSIQQDATNQIVNYEEILKSCEGKIGEEFYKGLKEGAEVLAQYKGNNLNEDSELKDSVVDNKYDFTSMNQQLKENELILINVSDLLAITLNASDDSLSEIRTTLNNSITQIKQYSTNNFRFDYSTLTQPEDSEPFFNEIKKLVQNGIMELVVEDYNSISKKGLASDSLPSDLLEKDSSVLTDVKDLLGSIDLDEGSNLLGNLLSGSTDQAATDLGEKAVSLILYQEYLKDHFGDFMQEKEPEHKALNYELEYILKGNDKDMDNLYSVVMQILTTRTILNLITLLSDGTKSNEAKLLAASFVGFTGMPLLVEAVKMIILTLWALVESIVDVVALLKDKAVPVFKTGIEIQVRLLEIMGINKTLIHKKAHNYKELKTPITLKYRDYIGLFLFFENKEKKLFKTMDLIQENLQRNYGEMFYMKNCLTGLRVTGVFHMKSKFVSIPFVSNYMEEDTSGYQYNFTREYTY